MDVFFAEKYIYIYTHKCAKNYGIDQPKSQNLPFYEPSNKRQIG